LEALWEISLSVACLMLKFRLALALLDELVTVLGAYERAT
jgi:hypothetical protein